MSNKVIKHQAVEHNECSYTYKYISNSGMFHVYDGNQQKTDGNICI